MLYFFREKERGGENMNRKNHFKKASGKTSRFIIKFYGGGV